MSSETYAILREPRSKMDLRQAAAALAKVLGRVRIDVTQELRDRPGILADGLTQQQAQKAAGLLRQGGIGVFVMAQSQMALPPPPIEICDGKLGEDGFSFIGPEGPITAPWGQIIFLDCARVGYDEYVKEQQIQMTAYYSRADADAYDPPVVSREVRRSKWKEFLDVVCYDPWVHFRIDRHSFRYAKTGLPLQSASHENFTQLIRAFKARAESAATGPGIRLLLDGDPRTRLSTAGLEAHDNYIQWRLQLLWRED